MSDAPAADEPRERQPSVTYKFSTLEEVQSSIEKYELETNSRFIQDRKDRAFGGHSFGMHHLSIENQYIDLCLISVELHMPCRFDESQRTLANSRGLHILCRGALRWRAVFRSGRKAAAVRALRQVQETRWGQG